MDSIDEYLLKESNITSPLDVSIPDSPAKFSLMDEIIELEWNIEKCMAEINESFLRSNIVSAHHRKCDKLLKKVDKIKESILEKYNLFTKNVSSDKENYVSRALRFEPESNSCQRSVQETCDMIYSYFENEYSRKAGLLDDTNRLSKETIWKKVEDVANGFTPDQIAEVLITNVRQSTRNLKELSSSINLKRDGDHLRFEFDTGKLKDLSCEPPLLQTIHQIIEAGQKSHFQTFLCCEREKNEASDLKRKLDSYNVEIDNILANRFDPSKAELIRRYFDSQQENAGISGSLQYLEEELDRLTVERNEKAKSLEVLLEKYTGIKLFEKTVQAKQLMIQKLIRNCISTKSSHCQQLQDIVASTEKKIIDLQQEITQLCNEYKELENEEVCSFMKIPLQNVLSLNESSQQGRLIRDMSIHRLDPRFQQAGEDNFRHVLKKIQVPEYAPPEVVLKSIMESKKDGSKDAAKNKSLNSKSIFLADITNRITNLKKDLSKRSGELDSSVIPSLKESERKTSDVISESIEFQNAIGIWADQPAQFSVPWVTTDGFNVKQYMDQFSTHIELLKEINRGKME